MAIEKIKTLAAVLERTAKQHYQFSPLGPIFEANGLDWQCCLAGSSKTAPRILIFSIVIGAYYSYEVKNSEIWAPTVFKHNTSFIATVLPTFLRFFTQLRTAYCTLQFLTYVFTQLALKIFVLDSYTVTKCNVTGLLYRPEINVITLAVSVVTFFGHLEIEMVQHNEILTLIYFSAAECTVTRQFFPSLIRLSKEW